MVRSVDVAQHMGVQAQRLSCGDALKKAASWRMDKDSPPAYPD